MKQYFLKYSESLNESLSSARKLYLDTNQISKEDFDKLVSFDPTPTKKYLEKMCEWYKEGVEMYEFQEPIKKFHRLLPKLEQKDINHYGEFDEFVQEMEHIESKTSIKKAITKRIKVILENEDVQITQPQTYEQSCILGAGTKWCTASAGKPKHWNDYTKKDLLTFYYIWFKKEKDRRKYKLAIGIDPNGTWKEIYDAGDERVGEAEVKEIISNYKIPLEIFVYVDKNLEDILNNKIKKKDYDAVAILITNVKKFQTPENLEKLIDILPKELPIESSIYVKSMISDVPSYQTEENFERFMDMNPSNRYVNMLMNEVPKFKDWYETNYKEQE